MPVVAQAGKEEPVAKTSSWQCKLGMHRWHQYSNTRRRCNKCKKEQYWDFWADGTWRDLDETT